MFTLYYKCFYINGYVDKPDCIVTDDLGKVYGGFKSLRTAKESIRKLG